MGAPNRPTVADDQKPTVGMVGRELQRRGEDTRAELLIALAVVPTLSAFDPATVRVRKPLFGFGARQPGPRADIDLAQRRKLMDLESARCGDDGCGVARSRQSLA